MTSSKWCSLLARTGVLRPGGRGARTSARAKGWDAVNQAHGKIESQRQLSRLWYY